MFPVVADSLAAGCLLAIGRDWLEQQRWYRALLRPSSAGLMLATVLVVNGYMGYNGVFIAGTALINLLIAVLIHRCVFCSRDLAARVLNWKPMAALGVLSYSLYLWQQPFLNRNSASWLAAFPQNLVFACAAAIASYTLLEKPLMQLRSRLRQKPLEQPPAEMQVAA
jgi:peptidoglycan/LPS O-acetylase OafA/YrhL